MNPKPEPQRNFVIGSEWLYYKFYSGPKTADTLLVEIIKPLTAEFFSAGIIDKWFFIRYSDPKLHVRVRYHIARLEKIGDLICRLQDAVKPLVDNDLIAKIQVDTYQREVERYGSRNMELSETLFFHDSVMQLQALEIIRGDQGETIRWLFGLNAIDRLLDDFGLDLPQKEALLARIKESFQREFGGGKGLKVMLDGKFRREKEMIQKAFGAAEGLGEAWGLINGFLQERSRASQPVVAEIIRVLAEQNQSQARDDLLTSYIHMMVNRLFRTRQRVHELVLYDFLHRQYKSLQARQKYNK